MIETIRRFNRFYARALGIFSSRYLDSDLTMTEVRILGEIDRDPGLTASAICATLGLDKSYLSRMIAHLEAQGLVTRERKAENRRFQSLFLTEKGHAASLALDGRANARIERQIASLTAAERTALVASMQTIERLLSPVVPPEKRRETCLTLRPAWPQELDTAMGFIQAAKAYLKAQGIDQWQTGYPDEACIARDIAAGKGIFLLDEAGLPVGYACVDMDGEPAYDALQGDWLTGLENRSYGVIHRLALSSSHRGRGLASAAFAALEEYILGQGALSVRVDTDDANDIMKHLLTKRGYTYCGVIRFDNSDKIAYEKVFPIP